MTDQLPSPWANVRANALQGLRDAMRRGDVPKAVSGWEQQVLNAIMPHVQRGAPLAVDKAGYDKLQAAETNAIRLQLALERAVQIIDGVGTDEHRAWLLEQVRKTHAQVKVA